MKQKVIKYINTKSFWLTLILLKFALTVKQIGSLKLSLDNLEIIYILITVVLFVNFEFNSEIGHWNFFDMVLKFTLYIHKQKKNTYEICRKNLYLLFNLNILVFKIKMKLEFSKWQYQSLSFDNFLTCWLDCKTYCDSY